MSNKQYTPEEQAVNRKLWIESLRSGKYKQGYGLLRDINDNYCCLGVACDILNIKHELNKNHNRYLYGNTRQVNVLPEEAYYALGINAIGSFTPTNTLADNNDILHEIRCLWELNDILMWNFNQIADFIENNEQDIINRI